MKLKFFKKKKIKKNSKKLKKGLKIKISFKNSKNRRGFN